MMSENQIREALAAVLEKRGLEIVGVRISKTDDITVTINSLESSVSMDDCVEVNRAFTASFDQDEYDYSLTVTSPGVKKEKVQDEE